LKYLKVVDVQVFVLFLVIIIYACLYEFWLYEYLFGSVGPMKLQLEIEKAIHKSGESVITSMDLKMKNKLHDKTSNINKDLLLKGLLKPFPKNCISLMTISGAKGSTVS